MRRISRPMLGLISAVAGGIVVFGLFQLKLFGRETNNPAPHFNVQNAPIDREARAVTSYAPVIKRAAPSVVNIYSTRTIRMRNMPVMPFFDSPMFRDFFGEDDSEALPTPRRGGRGNRQNGQTLTRKQQSLGSGIIVSPEGYILTANHVVQGADPDGVKVSLAAGGNAYTAKIVGTDPQTDVAVLKIDARDLAPIAIADSDKLEVGDIVMAIGNPFGVGQTVTMGMVSALGRTSLNIIEGGYEDFIQTDAPINQGNSGGALIDAEGRLIGINTAIFSPSGANAGIGFAVPINLARSVMERLLANGKVTRGYLGVGRQDVSPELAEAFGLPDPSGALVTEVMPRSPAARAGVQNGDVIREVNGKKVLDSDQFRFIIAQMAPGSKVTLKVLRSEGGKKPVEKVLTATLETLPPEQAGVSRPNRPESNERGNSSLDALDGVEVTDLDSNTRGQLNIPPNVSGALVTNVDPGSNSAEAGLHRGDVIVEIDRKPVKSADAAVRLSESAKSNRLLLRIWRSDRSLYLSVDNTKKSGAGPQSPQPEE